MSSSLTDHQVVESPAAVTGYWLDLGLTDEEYARVAAALGRTPNHLETAIFGVMWSEHCSYKSSRALLATLPTEGEHVLQGPGENAGVVDIGDGLAVAFKVESHNHPSAIEPYHGAATGVGGILRDVFTMGARPIALLDSLRFGNLDGDGDEALADRTRHLVSGVVEGIAGYGNCVGVPTVGGELRFDESYAQNPLVNAMCVGLMRHDQLQRGVASGVGNPVFVVGARTGRDGIQGATFASVEDPHGRERSAVQVGDPFMEKLLIEACMELLATGEAVGIQDMGAAGLTSSSVEMAARAGSGLEMDLDRVPRREAGMTPYELMLSESQERMLVVMRRGSERVAQEIIARWGLECAEVGTVTDDGTLRLLSGGKVVADLPLEPLVDGAPTYRRPVQAPGSKHFDPPADIEVDRVAAVLIGLLASQNIASRAWVHSQFDSMVGASTVVRPGSDAAVIAVRGTDRSLAMAMDCNGRWCELDPWLGAAHAVAEAARNVVCSGARPLAVTNCLNFSTPEDPRIAWQLEQGVAGMGAACRALETPVVSGNVSLYNRSGDLDVQPTPVIGMVGVIDAPELVLRSAWTADGNDLLLVGDCDEAWLEGSEYLQVEHGFAGAAAPPLDLELERRLHVAVQALNQAGLVASAHDVADGGLLVTLAESAIDGGRGATIRLARGARLDAVLFGEGASRIVLEVPAGMADRAGELLSAYDIRHRWLGRTGGDVLDVTVGDQTVVAVAVDQLEEAWSDGLPAALGERGGSR